MDFAFSEEQEEFRRTLRRFLEEKAPLTEVRRAMETPAGFDAVLWKQMSHEMGLHGLHIPEKYGGQGFGFLELEIALEEMGRMLACGPFFSSVCLAANAILNAGREDQKRAWLPGIASGESIATLALVEDSGLWDASGVAMRADPDGDEFVLSGTKTMVGDGHCADLVVVVARARDREGGGIALIAVEGGAPGLTIEPVETLDPTRRLSRLEFDNVRGQAIGQPGSDGQSLALTLDQAAVSLAAESAGGAERCLETAVAYAGERVQFARTIGSFQAIKHKCAEVLLEVEQAKATARWASWVANENPESLADAASVAKNISCDAYLRASQENLQIHGGIGFTWEADPHLYFKRAKTNEAMLGDSIHHRTRLIESRGV